ncbi:MAG: hypothetical protein AUK48_10350 [Oscillatoriales cyanobacterium CG2_30_44_21]|nr:MAG: hypothetical protein AUK48_10350 [Oscillatoriales cyanobacterium CG2_30_44_21]
MFFSKSFSGKQIMTASRPWLIAGCIILSLTSAVQAQSRRVKYVPPSNAGAPKVSVPGITRSACDGELSCLIALVPDLKVDQAPVPQTISKRPTIYFLTPKIDGRIYFRLDEDLGTESQRKRVYRSSFKIKNDAGIIAYKLPDDAPALELNKKYSWKLDIDDLSNTRSVYGSIRRVELDAASEKKLAAATDPLERAAILAAQGVWYEALQILAEAQITVPKNMEIIEQWTSLLKSANLDRVSPYSLVIQKPSVTQAPKPSEPKISNPY